MKASKKVNVLKKVGITALVIVGCLSVVFIPYICMKFWGMKHENPTLDAAKNPNPYYDVAPLNPGKESGNDYGTGESYVWTPNETQPQTEEEENLPSHWNKKPDPNATVPDKESNGVANYYDWVNDRF